MKKVVLINKWVSHYRLPFYESLKQELEANGVELILVYGEPVASFDRSKKDWVDIVWGHKIQNVGVGKAIWQPALPYLKEVDLIIVEQANKLLLNYILQFRRLLGKRKMAFWGHGKNYQPAPTMVAKIKEKLKQTLMVHVDWWFTYTEGCVQDISARGFKAGRITNVENAIDVDAIKKHLSEVSKQDIFNFRKEHKIEGENIGVFCGGLFKEKRLHFLLEAALRIRESTNDFELIIIGAGADQGYVESLAKEYRWIHYLGPLFGKQKVVAMSTAQVYLMPGLVGLGVLDAFALKLPVMTTKFEYHSPEIAYVRDKENGMIVDGDAKAYGKMVAKVLRNKPLLEDLKKGCEQSSERLTTKNMAKSFANGILACIAGDK